MPQEIGLGVIAEQRLRTADDLQPAVLGQLPLLRVLIRPFPSGLETTAKLVPEEYTFRQGCGRRLRGRRGLGCGRWRRHFGRGDRSRRRRRGGWRWRLSTTRQQDQDEGEEQCTCISERHDGPPEGWDMHYSLRCPGSNGPVRHLAFSAVWPAVGVGIAPRRSRLSDKTAPRATRAPPDLDRPPGLRAPDHRGAAAGHGFAGIHLMKCRVAELGQSDGQVRDGDQEHHP